MPTREDSSIHDEAIRIPYKVQKSILEKSSGAVYDYARLATHKVPVPPPFNRNKKGGSISNSRPHAKQSYPEFQQDMYKLTAHEWAEYEYKLTEFTKRAFPKPMATWAIRMLRNRSPSRQAIKAHAGESIPDQIWQTGKDLPTTRNSFQDKNSRIAYNFYNDNLLESWSKEHFIHSLVQKTWNGMERIVLKADFWRYLVTYLEGGYYSDTDTDCLKPVNEWGKTDAVVWDLGDKVTKEIAYGPPQVIVGIEVDVPDVTGWESFWP